MCQLAAAAPLTTRSHRMLRRSVLRSQPRRTASPTPGARARSQPSPLLRLPPLRQPSRVSCCSCSPQRARWRRLRRRVGEMEAPPSRRSIAGPTAPQAAWPAARRLHTPRPTRLMTWARSGRCGASSRRRACVAHSRVCVLEESLFARFYHPLPATQTARCCTPLREQRRRRVAAGETPRLSAHRGPPLRPATWCCTGCRYCEPPVLQPNGRGQRRHRLLFQLRAGRGGGANDPPHSQY